MRDHFKKVVLVLLLSVFVLQISNFTVIYATEGLEIILDNGQIGFTCTPAASWVTDTSLADAYGTSARVINADGTIGKLAKWTPSVSVTGYYKVYMTWPTISTPAPSAAVEISYNGGGAIDKSKRINQAHNTGYWVDLGTYYMTSGSADYIALRADLAGNVVADAIKLVLTYDMTGMNAPVSVSNTTPIGFDYDNAAYVLQNREDNSFSLSVGGQPYDIKGVCKSEGMDKIKQAGGNTFRTYSAPLAATGALLDEAQSLGMKVVLGLWMNHETSSFTYANSGAAVAAQLNNLKAQVDAFKSHPALLMWAVGNEVDSTASNDIGAIHRAINDLAAYIKSVDPYHPITSVHAGSHVEKIVGIRTLSPYVDVVSFNSYKHVGNIYGNVAQALWQGAYMVTEFSTDQPSEMGASEKTANGILVERSDYAKAHDYYNRYRQHIANNKDKCLGSFAFATWGTYRGTHTWYNIFLEDDFKSTPIYDALYKAWNGTERSVLSPAVVSMRINGIDGLDDVHVLPNQTCTAKAGVISKESEALTYAFEIRENNVNNLTQSISGITFTADGQDPSRVTFNAPVSAGIYRLFCYAYDQLGNVGAWNIPFEVSTLGVSPSASVQFASKENFDYSDGSFLSAIEADSNNGWATGYFADKNMTQAVNTAYSINNLKFAHTTSSLSESVSLYRQMTQNIDFDTDGDYAIMWNMSIGSPVSGAYNSLKIDLIGTANLAIGVMNDADVKTELHPIVKIGNGAVNYDIATSINLGQEYTGLLHISTKASGQDSIKFKVYPKGYQEPSEWNLSLSQTITGYSNILGMVGAPNRSGVTVSFDDVTVEKYNSHMSYLINEAELALANMFGTEEYDLYYQDVLGVLYLMPNSVIKVSVTNRLDLLIPYLTEYAFYANGQSVYQLEEGRTTCRIKVVNPLFIERKLDLTFIAAVYDTNGAMINLKSLKALNTILTEKSVSTYEIQIEVPPQSHRLKTFAWNSYCNLSNYIPVLSLTSGGVDVSVSKESVDQTSCLVLSEILATMT